MSRMNVVSFPPRDLGDIPRGLRDLADRIESGDFDHAYNFAWVIDCGSSRVEIGMLGNAGEPGPVAHLLYAIAQRKLEDI